MNKLFYGELRSLPFVSHYSKTLDFALKSNIFDVFIHESNSDFLVRKSTENSLLGWLTFHKLGYVEFYTIFGKKLNFYYSVSFLSDKAVFSSLEDTKITSFKKSFLEYKREDIFCVTSPRYARAKMYLTSSWGIITISQIRASWVKKIYE